MISKVVQFRSNQQKKQAVLAGARFATQVPALDALCERVASELAIAREHKLRALPQQRDQGSWVRWLEDTKAELLVWPATSLCVVPS